MTKPVEPDNEVTQGEIARRLGISRERVGFLERQALRKLKAALSERGMTFADFCDLVQRGKVMSLGNPGIVRKGGAE